MSVRYCREPTSPQKKLTSSRIGAFDEVLVCASSGVFIGLQSTIPSRSRIVKA